MKHSSRLFPTVAVLAIAAASSVLSSACSSSSSDPTSTSASTSTTTSTTSSSGFQIVSVSGGPLHAVAGDAIALKVVQVDGDASTRDLPSGTKVTWTSPVVLTTAAHGSDPDPSPMPTFSDQPTVVWIDNPTRTDRNADLANTLFVLDPGIVQNATVEVTATVSGMDPDAGQITATVTIDPTPAGDWSRGATAYASTCAPCHGATGHGSPANADGSFTLLGATYDYPAPGINAEPGNAASDPGWTAALIAIASRVDMDNGGVSLRAPMLDWLTTPNAATGKPLTTQDFADIYAFLKTQTQ